MMRRVLSLALVLGAAAEHECELSSADSVAKGVDTAMDIWAASKRCTGSYVKEAPVKCTQDVAASIEDMTALGATIAEMVGSCGHDSEEDECAGAGNEVVSATAGLTAASAKIADMCAHLEPHSLDHPILSQETLLGKCTANAAESMNSLFEAHNALQKLHDTCIDKGHGSCRVDSLDVVTVLSEFGAYIAEAYSHCGMYNDGHREVKKSEEESHETAECASAVLEGIGELTELADLGLKMKKACHEETSRLYLTRRSAQPSAGATSPMFLTVALLISVALSFVAGMRFARSSHETQRRFQSIPTNELLEVGPEE